MKKRLKKLNKKYIYYEVQYIRVGIDNMNDGMITIGVLAKAIRNCVDKKGLEYDETVRMAEHVMNFFGFNERILDNILEPEDRDAFYTLEEYGLLVTEREETTLYDGREWRVHYWKLKKDVIMNLTNHGEPEKRKRRTEDYSFYDEIPEDIWKRESNNLVE